MKNHTVVQLKAIAKERGIRGYYKLRKGELIHALEATRLVDKKVTSLMSRFQTIPLQFYNQHLGYHQISRWKIIKIYKIWLQKTFKRQKNSLLWVCKRLNILASGCWVTYHQNQKWLTKWLSLLKTKLKKLWNER